MTYIHKDKQTYYIFDELSLTIPRFSESSHLIYLSNLIKNTTKVEILLHLYVDTDTLLETRITDKWDDFSVSIAKIPIHI